MPFTGNIAPGLRDRNGRPILGSATARPAIQLGGASQNIFFSPWGLYTPWFMNGYGANFGYVSMDPWRYGTTSWVWSPYGLWPYDPWSDPFYSPYGYSSASVYGGGSRGEVRTSNEARESGSLRLRVSPTKAKVYIDGTLQGTVDDFNGLGSHLSVPAGAHTLEFKADGYQVFSSEIQVESGKTETFRATLKKK